MRCLAILIACAAWSAMVGIPRAESEARPVVVEKSLGGFNLADKHLKTDAQLRALLGVGCSSHLDGPVRAYWFPDAQTKGEFRLDKGKRVVAVRFFREKSPHKKCSTRRTPENFKTGRGVRLGDPVSRVVEVYGEPTRKEWISEKELKIFRYNSSADSGDGASDSHSRPLVMEIGFRLGYVSSILLAVSD